ncbi:MAG: two pore domain potassium channel family protein, partial [Bacteroidetes bacterium]|nr:two pore domain potassium channel family protein [Bacteroidota bacterium]MBU1760994.1 two pore domain potassium channel family protein [Bacteroidota bacterium]
MVNKSKSAGSFLLHLWEQISHTVVLLVLIALVYIYLMQFLDHNLPWIPYLVISLALVKTIYFTF